MGHAKQKIRFQFNPFGTAIWNNFIFSEISFIITYLESHWYAESLKKWKLWEMKNYNVAAAVTVKRHLHVQAICANLFAQIAWRLLQVAQAFRLLKLRSEFFNSFIDHGLIESFFILITYFFSTFRYFSLYLFSNLAFCSFLLFLYSVLVKHHSAGSDLYSSINSIKNCRRLAVPLEDIAWSIVL